MVDTTDTGKIGISTSSKRGDPFGIANYPGQTLNVARRHQRTLNSTKNLPAVETQRV